MTKTPNIALNIIPFDQLPWDVDANENTTIIDGILGQFFAIPNFVGVWKNSTTYVIGQSVIDAVGGGQWRCNVSHTSNAAPGTFAGDRATNPANWTQTSASAATLAAAAVSSVSGANTGRNLFHNSGFRVHQRDVGPWNVSGYTADRWMVASGAGGTRVVTLVPIPASSFPTDESMTTVWNCVVMGGVAVGDFELLRQRVENVRATSGKTVTISFWAWSIGAMKVGVNALQIFGTGGSPSAGQYALPIGSQVVTTTVPTRYSVTIPIPSVAGKTLGTVEGSDYLEVQFWFSSGATNTLPAGNVGVQAGTLNFWGMQLEFGSIASPLEAPDKQTEMVQCQRFYISSGVNIWPYYGYTTIGTALINATTLPVPMRTVPTINYNFTTNINVTTPTIVPASNIQIYMMGIGTVTGPFGLQSPWNASAEL